MANKKNKFKFLFIFNHREIAKTITWRLCASTLTFIIILILTKNIVLVSSFIGISLLIKMVGYYFHEKLWNNFNKIKFNAEVSRSVIKTLSWRGLALIVTFGILYFGTKNMALSSIGVSIEFILKTVLYYIHERIWNNIRLSKIKKERTYNEHLS